MLKQGIDIVNIKRIEKLYLKYGKTFLLKVFTEEERVLFVQKEYNISFLAKRFAAKEAFAKATGFGFNNGLKLVDIAILNNKEGCPYIKLSLKLQQALVAKFGNFKSSVSLSDEEKYAIASVIIYSL